MPAGDSYLGKDFVATVITWNGSFVPSPISGRATVPYKAALLLIGLDGSRKLVDAGGGPRYPSHGLGMNVLAEEGGVLYFQTEESLGYQLQTGQVIKGEPKRRMGGGLPLRPESYVTDLPETLAHGRYRAKLLRDAPSLTNPAGQLLTFLSQPGMKGTQVLERIDAAGKTVWKTDTGVWQFTQILANERVTVLRGVGIPIPDKLSVPYLAIVDHATGRMEKHWLQR